MKIITKRIAKRAVKDRAPYVGVTYNVLRYFVDAVHVEETTDSIEGVPFRREIDTIALSVRSTSRSVSKGIGQLVNDALVKQHQEPNTYSLSLEPLMKLPTRAELKRKANRERQRRFYERHKSNRSELPVWHPSFRANSSPSNAQV